MRRHQVCVLHKGQRMNAIPKAIAAAIAIAATGTASAAVHTVEYSKIQAAAGTGGTRGETDYTLVRIPFRTFGSQLKYSVVLPVKSESGAGAISGFIQTTHTDAPLLTNATIDGVAARISVHDGRHHYAAGA